MGHVGAVLAGHEVSQEKNQHRSLRPQRACGYRTHGVVKVALKSALKMLLSDGDGGKKKGRTKAKVRVKDLP